jgi:hypothetical protein
VVTPARARLDGSHAIYFAAAFVALVAIAVFLANDGPSRLGPWFTRLIGAPIATADLANGDIVDGYMVGHAIDCSTGCRDALSFAKSSAISTRSLDPTAIKDIHVFSDFDPPSSSSGRGGVYIVVYDLRDGSRIATGVYCFDQCQLVPPAYRR